MTSSGAVSAVERADVRGLLRVGGLAALASVALIVVQVAAFAVWPPVHTVPEIFALMNTNPMLGLVSLDVLYVVNNLLVWLFYLGLGAALFPVSRSAVIVAVGLGTLQMAAYLASNPAVEMLTLARAHASTADAPGRAALAAAGEAVLTGWKGTAFLAYYFLGAIVLFVFFWLLRRTTDFPPSTARWALASGVLMLVPSSFGTVGLVFALASLVPWSVLCVVGGRRLLRLAASREASAAVG